MSKWAALASVSLLCCCVVARDGVADGESVLVGVAQADITPQVPMRMYGYGARTTESEGIAGPLRAKSLAIGSDEAAGPAILLTVDCGADADPCPHGTVDLCEQHGRAIANEVQRLLSGPLSPISGPLVARQSTLTIPCVPRPSLDEIRARAAGSYTLRELLRRIDAGEDIPESQSYQITTWAFGDTLAMVFLSDEVVVDYALRLKRELGGRRLWITAYAQDVSHYIVSDRLIGEGGYEVDNSLNALVSYGDPAQLQPSVEERIVRQVHEMLSGSTPPSR